MKAKGVKLIIGIILVLAIVLYFANVLNPWLCLAIGVIGLIFAVISFGEKKETSIAVPSKPAESIESSVSSVPEEEKETGEPVEVGAGQSDKEKPLM